MTFIKIYDKTPKIMKMYEFMMSANSVIVASNFILEIFSDLDSQPAFANICWLFSGPNKRLSLIVFDV